MAKHDEQTIGEPTAQYMPPDIADDVVRLALLLTKLGFRSRFLQNRIGQADVLRYALCALSDALDESPESVGDTVRTMTPWLEERLNSVSLHTHVEIVDNAEQD